MRHYPREPKVPETMKQKDTGFLTEKEAQGILKNPLSKTLRNKRDSAIFLTLLRTDLRKAEIYKVRGSKDLLKLGSY